MNSSQKNIAFYKPAAQPTRCRAGFSMSEMIVVIAILGVLAGVVVIMLQGAFGASQEALAKARVEMLNSALHTWSTANREIYFPPNDGSGEEELYILRELQFRDPNPLKAKTGSPYVPPEYNPVASSNKTDFRIRWNGRLYELLLPDQEGSGLLMDFAASDFTTPHQFPENYKSGSF
ncbi:type II secretion system protein [Prosthecobacter dejongeii]|uniref:Prepilin-type N-terminal cleavage/methylation domain-containing protein n=1 Tax=Prosthecobacter dejongeii TaxID=48465 RepID=A0A7W7YLI9_9BACT|nr:type II secretion system protein [Prosthecobacter dejongeii]MBB5038202.1 prepilin-type N-terminal cleavage/methylation domain-containing protein [Prosthecobacter dejongeii]